MHVCIIQASTCVRGTSPRITQTTALLHSPILIETVQHVERTLAKQLGTGNSNETADKPANSDTLIRSSPSFHSTCCSWRIRRTESSNTFQKKKRKKKVKPGQIRTVYFESDASQLFEQVGKTKMWIFHLYLFVSTDWNFVAKWNRYNRCKRNHFNISKQNGKRMDLHQF